MSFKNNQVIIDACVDKSQNQEAKNALNVVIRHQSWFKVMWLKEKSNKVKPQKFGTPYMEKNFTTIAIKMTYITNKCSAWPVYF